MRVLNIKRSGLVANLSVVGLAGLLATSLSAAIPIDKGNKAAPGRFFPPGGASAQSGAKNRVVPPRDPSISQVVPQTCVPAKGQFLWNFEEEELIKILTQVSDLLCKTFVIHDSINKSMKMTIIGKSLLTPKDAWDVLMASLTQKGLALVEQGKTWTVIKRPDIKNYSTPLYAKGEDAKNNEEIGTLFYKAEHASQDALKNISKMLISRDGIVENIGDQFIIVIDSNSNIRRLGSIFAQVDLEDAQNKIHIIKLVNAEAKTAEKQLRDLFDVSGATSRIPRRRSPTNGVSKSSLNIDKIIADDRTNSLILVCDQDTFEKTQQVVAMLDVKDTDTNKGTIHVKRLKYADAKKIAETINGVVQQGSRSKSRFARPRDEGTNELFEGEVKITAHEDTNTLVTVASANDYRSLLATINKLDIRKDQVYIEAVIMDIKIDTTNKFGINLFSGLDGGLMGLNGSLGMVGNPGGRNIAQGISTTLATAGSAASDIGGLGNQSIGALAVLGNFLSGGVAGIVGPTIGNTKIPTFGAVLQAIATDSSIDVLSTPYLLTSDNVEATMSVGEKIPVIKGASSVGGAAGLGGVPMQNITYEPVELSFKLTPHVGADDNVRLDIEQKVEELGNKETLLNASQYRINTKTAKTTIVLKDQQTGVIGGLMSNRASTLDNKVPFLGDIPILGWLFKNRESANERRSLALIVTPYIIKTDDDYKKIVERKLKEREEFANLYYGGKIQNYNKTIDYEKKAGPVSSMIRALDDEMKKAENGGPGDGTETIIVPSEGSASSGSDMPSIVVGESIRNDSSTAFLDEGDGPQDDFSFEENISAGADDAPEASFDRMGMDE